MKEKGQTVQIRDGVKLPCPACGETVILGFSADDEPVGLHKNQPCPTWLEMDLEDFASYCRAHYGQADG